MNLYDDPESEGFTLYAAFNSWGSLGCCFDCYLVLENEEGFWIGYDSGCVEMAEPFENASVYDDFDGPYDMAGVKRRLDFLHPGVYDELHKSM